MEDTADTVIIGAGIIGLSIAIFEMSVVIILRAHYSLDVIAGLMAALVAWHLACKIAPAIDKRV